MTTSAGLPFANVEDLTKYSVINLLAKVNAHPRKVYLWRRRGLPLYLGCPFFQISLKAHAPRTPTSSIAVHPEGAAARAPNPMIAQTRKII
jgi:hypothetical protein